MDEVNKRLGMLLAGLTLLAFGCRQQPPTEPPPHPVTPAAIQVGGEDVLTLSRKATSSGNKPEFLSVTLFPGRG
jgi:aldose 1-epimerase